jgi:hypothetical protein
VSASAPPAGAMELEMVVEIPKVLAVPVRIVEESRARFE